MAEVSEGIVCVGWDLGFVVKKNGVTMHVNCAVDDAYAGTGDSIEYSPPPFVVLTVRGGQGVVCGMCWLLVG